MGTGYLIDSNTIIDFFNKSLPESGRKFLFEIAPVISIVTYIEVLGKRNVPDIELEQIKTFTDVAIIYEVDRIIAGETIKLKSRYKIKLPDAIIAATAMYYNLTLITRNTSDFDKIEGLEFINPHTL